MTQPQGISPAVPWLLLGSGSIPYLSALIPALLQTGDSPATAGLLENFLLVSWLLTFSTAVLAAKATKDPPTFHGVLVLSFTLAVIGFAFVF